MNDSDEIQETNRRRAEELGRIPLFKPDQSKWPKSIRPISFEELSIVGVDKEGHLYWDGKPIELKRKIELGFFERLLAGAAALGTFGVFIIECTHLLNTIEIYCPTFF